MCVCVCVCVVGRGRRGGGAREAVLIKGGWGGCANQGGLGRLSYKHKCQEYSYIAIVYSSIAAALHPLGCHAPP